MKNHIVIIGFNGSGKKRVGKRLAKDLGLPYVDVDKEIVRKMKMSINEIYTRFGEPFYRALETTQIKELAEIDLKCVISVGAGLPLQEQNHKCLKELGTVVYLKASVETLASVCRTAGIFTAEKMCRRESKNFWRSAGRFMRKWRTLRWSQARNLLTI